MNPSSSRSPTIDGFDRSGMVRVTLGRDGLPVSISVDEDWQQYLRPGQFDGAVAEARDSAEQLLLRALVDQPFDESAAATIADTRPVPPIEDADAWLAATVATLDELRQRDPEAAAPRHAVGTAAFGRLRIVLTGAGLDSCTADPGWAMQRTGTELTEALATALSAARDDLAAADPAAGLTRLLSQGLAILDGAWPTVLPVLDRREGMAPWLV